VPRYAADRRCGGCVRARERCRRTVATQATWSQPVADEVLFSNDFASRLLRPTPIGHFDSPGVPDGAEQRLLVLPPDPAYLEVVLRAEPRGGRRGHTSAHKGQFQPFGDSLLGEVVEHHLASDVVVRRGRHHQRPDGQTGDVDGDHPLGTLRAAERPLPGRGR
jgi:hypothetical protein